MGTTEINKDQPSVEKSSAETIHPRFRAASIFKYIQ